MSRGIERIAVRAAGAAPAEAEADALALPVFEDEVRGGGTGAVKDLDRLLDGALLAAARAERFTGKAGQELALPTLGRARAGRVVLMGMGARAKALEAWGRDGYEALRAAAGKAARGAEKAGARTLALAAPELDGGALPGAARALAEGALLGAYRFSRYRKDDPARPAGVSEVAVLVPPSLEKARAVKDALELARRLAGAVAWARDLVNLGPADCTPELLARAASEVARRAGLSVEVRGPKELQALKMGMFLGVTRGSAEPPRLVKVSWVPRGAAGRRAPVVLVGKAITFDSGGLSLKPTESMVTMNTDMAGSAAVLGAMQVIAALKPPFPVHAVLGACENMPGGRAYKPSDVLVAHDGQTVEITNTDAEGRLVLGDVLSWAAETLKPAAMIDVATLTGACIVALGNGTAGLFGPDGPVADGVLAAARAAGEDVWRLPMTEGLKDQLKSDRADLKNTGERWGGAITAAHFLHAFTKDAPWAHLDIAGPSHSGKEQGYVAKGGTGFAVRTLVEFVRAWEA
ncbi:leucyl aminopeptidase [Anaeromyxobacter dehalogenans]|uniref:Probable cytosol aminopeptidase n=1 Tax=Anaeromyxobacter dehalogenans (strain 2CP-C) TaxID=290397 RepID=Q2IH05_ANADE|nr:leucyl aminopeptidase [Anaeromyxobacter dehalogenans]ABC83861.1 Leucyl aminopeptidase [Anaeromyxobacter dehalogenans 2CP-C]